MEGKFLSSLVCIGSDMIISDLDSVIYEVPAETESGSATLPNTHLPHVLSQLSLVKLICGRCIN
jgi:hypothetical protein